MKTKLMSAFVDVDGDVVALTQCGIYRYKQKLKDPQMLLDKIAKVHEINTDHWIQEHTFENKRIEDEY